MRNPTDLAAESDTGVPKWVYWAWAAIAAMLLVAEHRVQSWGWGLHTLFGLCLVVLFVLIRATSPKSALPLR